MIYNWSFCPNYYQILSNGKYKSVVHRAIVNDDATRISLAFVNGPCLDTVVRPAPELVQGHDQPVYTGMKYKEYLELQQSSRAYMKPCIDFIRI